MRSCRTRWGLAVAAGLAWLAPAGAAHAQVSYGYDSLVYGGAPAQSYYNSWGYSSLYTEPSTAMFTPGMPTPPRTVAPYDDPPYGTFGQGNNLPGYTYHRSAAVAPPAKAVVTTKRRGLFGRTRTRR